MSAVPGLVQGEMQGRPLYDSALIGTRAREATSAGAQPEVLPRWLDEQQRHLKQSRTTLKHEQQVHADRKARLEAREAALGAREASSAARQAELEAWHRELEEYQAAQHWGLGLGLGLRL